jgi:pilus assembly protein CpaC
MQLSSCRLAVFAATLSMANTFGAQTTEYTGAVATPPAARRAAPDNAPRTQQGTSNTLRPCTSVTVDPPTYLTLGRSQVVRLAFPVTRMIVGGQSTSRAGRPVNVTPGAQGGAPTGAPPAPNVAPAGTANDGVADTEITLLSPNELFFLGRKSGSMNVVLQGNDGRCVVKDLFVTIDPASLQGKLSELLPEETGVAVRAADNAIVLTGSVSDGVKLDQVVSLAGAYGDGRKVVNMLNITSPQQVMLEVQIAEVSKNLLDKLGSSLNVRRTSDSGNNVYSLISSFLSNGGGLLQALRIGTGSISIDGQKNDGIARILAEPNIMAISGQSASFLSGGRIFIPVAQANSNGAGTTVTLEEKEFGVGLKFTPTVLTGNRVNLKLVSEVSELAQTGSPFTTVNGVTAILPSLTTRRADTTVQLQDGQSLVIAGLIRSNVSEAMKKYPGLGDAPVLGALFRSTEFQNDQTELMFVVTPRLVKPLAAAPLLPTDNHVVPRRGQLMLDGRLEGPDPGAARPAP